MKIILAICFIFLVNCSLAQTTIQGVVKDQKGETIPGVNIFLKGTFEGTSSEIDGTYFLETKEEGTYTLVFQSMGFKSQEFEVVLNGNPQTLNPILREAINEMTAVTISAGAMEASDEKRAVVLRPIDIVTVPSAMGDIIGAFQTLPGTANVGNDGRLFVRGGDATETAIFIDGLKVGNAFGTTASNVPTRTRFNPNLFKGSFFSTGGYSAEYGQALSSALALNTVDFPVRNQGDISIMSVGGGYTQTLAGEKNSLTASANYFDLSPYQALVKQNFDWERAPYGWDAEVSGRKKWGKNGVVKAFVHTEANGMKIWQPLPDSDERGQLVGVQNQYTFAQTSFRQLGENDWSYYGGISYSNNVDKFDLDQMELRNQNQLVHSKLAAIKGFSEKFSVKTGFESYLFNYEEALISEDLKRDFRDHHAILFSEADFYINNRLVFRGGIRAGHSSLAGQSWLDPRISLAYKFDNNGQLSLAAGQFSQMPVEQLRVLEQSTQNTRADHLILNYFLVKNGRTIRAEAFYKDYKNLITYEVAQLFPMPLGFDNIQQNGEGYARGMDVFYRDQKSFKNTDFWVTYSFVDSRRKFAHFTEMVQPGFAPRHNGSIVVKHFISSFKSQLGVSVSANDGYTYENPNLPGQMNSKTKSFQDLSLSWSYLAKPNLIIHLACSNVLGRDNIFGYQYANEPNENGVYEGNPIRLQAPRFLFLGIFLTLSKDKNANNLNNL
ncbi:TonB-dependent Receptor Plug Domain [Aquiflexum balticum DSM 16537]|uniref:TonB-dependent Receptor Plug Domain n=1 Tax=Aquiflexum balticum DSM 16537 TaxID=758820 RepID=A0A1W2H0X9_9BACT|nr:TonB-dependent receptor [Aquiflexum balticum]SMD42414.1 TonB-dependent Receptor Plug Domain [Aquiflexum balticum DSM 16537]